MTDERNWSCWRGEAGADREEMTRRCATPRGEQRCRYRARRARVASWAGCPSRVRPIPNSYCAACYVKWACALHRVVTALESCAKGFVFTNTNDSNVGGAVKTRIGPDMCARRRERVSFLDVFHTSGREFTHERTQHTHTRRRLIQRPQSAHRRPASGLCRLHTARCCV